MGGANSRFFTLFWFRIANFYWKYNFLLKIQLFIENPTFYRKSNFLLKIQLFIENSAKMDNSKKKIYKSIKENEQMIERNFKVIEFN